jgi:hypothetical protein
MGSLLLVCDKTHSLHTPTASMYHWSVSKMSLLCFNIRTAVCMLTSSSSKMTWNTLDSYTQYLDLLLPCWKTRLIFQIAQAKHVEAPNSCKKLRTANECFDSYIQVHAVFLIRMHTVSIDHNRACNRSRLYAYLSMHILHITPDFDRCIPNARFRLKTPIWARSGVERWKTPDFE